MSLRPRVVLVLSLFGCNSPEEVPPDGGQPCGTESGTGCAPDSERVDLYDPVFSDPTSITNPWYPISDLLSVVFIGEVDGLPFRTETTLLPDTRTITFDGRSVTTLASQYMAFSNGRIEEIATDWYAQDDDGAVWYLGEDVSDYDPVNGTVFTTEGTWLAGQDGAPIAMIMSGEPAIGQVWRAENIAPIAFEEITIVEVDVPLDGPSGDVLGIIGSELHMDSTRQEKVFVPGYGEFSTGSLATEDLEALALAISTDALTGPVPPDLEAMSTATASIFAAAGNADWPAVASAAGDFDTSWATAQTGQLPGLLAAEVVRISALMTAAIAAEDAASTRHQAIALARPVYDLQLRFRPPAEVDLVRLDLWLAQVAVDADALDLGALRSDADTLSFVWDRIVEGFDPALAPTITGGLSAIATAAATEDSAAAATEASDLRAAIGELGWR